MTPISDIEAGGRILVRKMTWGFKALFIIENIKKQQDVMKSFYYQGPEKIEPATLRNRILYHLRKHDNKSRGMCSFPLTNKKEYKTEREKSE